MLMTFAVFICAIESRVACWLVGGQNDSASPKKHNSSVRLMKMIEKNVFWDDIDG